MHRGGFASGGRPQKINKATLKRVVGLFRPFRTQVWFTVFLVLLSAGLGMLQPFLLRRIVNEGILREDLHVITVNSLLTVAIVFAGTLLQLVFGYVSTVVGNGIMRDLRTNLFAHLQGMSLKFFTGTRTGEIQSRLANDVGGVQGVVSDSATNILNNLVTVISTIVAMSLMDWRLTLLSVGILPLFAWVASKVGGLAGKHRKTSQEQMADLNSTMNETLSVSGILLTKTSGRQAMALDRFRGQNQAMTSTNVKVSMIMRAFFSVMGLTFQLTPVLVYWLAGYLLIGQKDPGLSLGTIVAFTSLQGRLFFPMTGLLNIQVEIGSAMALFERIFEYLDLQQEITDAPDAKHLDPHGMNGKVEFSDVSFRYSLEQERRTLDGVSLSAEAGQLVALVGASGAGKTTLTYLIPRLYDVESGKVSIDGMDVRQIAQESLGKLIGVVTQETYLVHDTILENLRYGRPDATDEEVQDAAKAAAIHDHIMSLPEQYQTVVGERGYKLSGGEKQRVSIARAILKDPRILILDEATSALDTQSERLVQAALGQLMAGRTTFAVAHRLSTIQSADQILVMKEGKIVERGTHTQLLELGGEYFRLYQLGFDEPTENPPAGSRRVSESERSLS